jgi:hypothetical protein
MGRRAAAALLAGVLTMGALTACRVQPCSSGCTGTVIKTEKQKCSAKAWCVHRFYVTVKTGDSTDRGQVTEATYKACQVGEPWPACKTKG